MHACDHADHHSGQSRYAPDRWSRRDGSARAVTELRYVVVCDRCGAEVRVLHAVDYRPEPCLDAVPPRPA